MVRISCETKEGNCMSDLHVRGKGYVCISSICVEEESFMDYRYTAYKAAIDAGYEVCRCPEDIGSTQQKFEQYLDQKRPIFVLLIGQKKSAAVEKECQIALSLGLPIITLLKSKGENTTPQTKQIVKSISKFTFEKECSCFENCEDLYKQVYNRLIEYENERMQSTAILIPNHEQVYTKSKEIIEKAKKRIIICQCTSSLVLGPRKGVNSEKEFYETLLTWIKNGDKNMEFLHLFSFKDTKDKLTSDEYNCFTAKENLINLYNEKPQTDVVIRAVKANMIPCVICDNTILALLQLGDHEYNLLLPQYITNSKNISEIVSDLQGVTGSLLYCNSLESTYNIESFYI